MPFATFRGEKTVAEITDKLFSRLTPRQREKAEAAILKANPRLGTISKLRKGSILRIPNLADLHAKTNRSLENPDAQIAKNITNALDTFGKRMVDQASIEQGIIKQQGALLKSGKFKKALANAPDLQALANDAAKVLSARPKAIVERKKNVDESIRQALKDLQESLI